MRDAYLTSEQFFATWDSTDESNRLNASLFCYYKLKWAGDGTVRVVHSAIRAVRSAMNERLGIPSEYGPYIRNTI